jgi:flavorubredoxin
MRPRKMAEDVYWVGVLDWDERDFHNFQTPRGLTYNSYLILDEKKVLAPRKGRMGFAKHSTAGTGSSI